MILWDFNMLLWPLLTLSTTRRTIMTAQILEGLRDSALPICMDLVKATNAYSEAKAAIQKASVVKEDPSTTAITHSLGVFSYQFFGECHYRELQPSRGVVQPQVPAETNVGAEEKKQDANHHVISASPSPATRPVSRPMATAVDWPDSSSKQRIVSVCSWVPFRAEGSHKSTQDPR
jgi:hypothetical protein